jgi:hypothetical protein
MSDIKEINDKFNQGSLPDCLNFSQRVCKDNGKKSPLEEIDIRNIEIEKLYNIHRQERQQKLHKKNVV